jgi:hypothetical protein
MKWLNLEIATLHSATFIGEDPVARSTWLSLLTYCAEQENGGMIADCAGWKDRQWQQVMGVTLEEVKRPSGLWAWENGGLKVWKYPEDQERVIEARRKSAKKTNKIRWSDANIGTGVEKPGSSTARPAPPLVREVEDFMGELYGRAKGSPWPHDEEMLLVQEVMSRPEFDDEFNRILNLREKMEKDGRLKFFPRSVKTLLEKWLGLLDQAGAPASDWPPKGMMNPC